MGMRAAMVGDSRAVLGGCLAFAQPQKPGLAWLRCGSQRCREGSWPRLGQLAGRCGREQDADSARGAGRLRWPLGLCRDEGGGVLAEQVSKARSLPVHAEPGSPSV